MEEWISVNKHKEVKNTKKLRRKVGHGRVRGREQTEEDVCHRQMCLPNQDKVTPDVLHSVIEWKDFSTEYQQTCIIIWFYHQLEV